EAADGESSAASLLPGYRECDDTGAGCAVYDVWRTRVLAAAEDRWEHCCGCSAAALRWEMQCQTKPLLSRLTFRDCAALRLRCCAATVFALMISCKTPLNALSRGRERLRQYMSGGQKPRIKEPRRAR